MSEAQSIRDRFGQLKSLRATYEPHWQEIAEVIRPVRADFNRMRQVGDKKMSRVFDGTPMAGAVNLAAGLFGAGPNPTNSWVEIELADPELAQLDEVKLWCSIATKEIHRVCAERGNWAYSEIFTSFQDVAAFGPGILYCAEGAADARRGARIVFLNRPLHECFLAQDSERETDTLYRQCTIAARDAVRSWGARLAANSKCQQLANTAPFTRVPFIHAVEPNPDYRPGALGPKGKAFRDLYLEDDTNAVLEDPGFHEFPYAVFRWGGDTTDPYGPSPGQMALPDSKMLQQVEKANILATQQAVDPTKLMSDKLKGRAASFHPGSKVYGAMSADGKQLVKTLETGSAIQFGLQMAEQKRMAAREAFLWSLMLMTPTPDMTATEWLGRQEERVRVLAPHLVSIQAGLEQLLYRILAILIRIPGALPPPPDAIVISPSFKFNFISPLARAADVQKASGIVRGWGALQPVAELRPDIFDNFDLDAQARVVGKGMGFPSETIRDPRKVEADRAARAKQQAQQQQAAMAAELAPAMAGAAKDAAQARQALQGAA